MMNLTNYHQALIDAIAAYFGDSLETVQAYFPQHQSEDQNVGLLINTPAVLVEIERLNLSEEAERGDGTDAIECSVVIHCLLSSQTENLQLELRNFAAEMLRLLAKHGFMPCGQVTRPQSLDALPGTFKAGQGGYDSFVVTFTQVIYLGESVWKPNAVPHQIYFGRSVNEQNMTGYKLVYESPSSDE